MEVAHTFMVTPLIHSAVKLPPQQIQFKPGLLKQGGLNTILQPLRIYSLIACSFCFIACWTSSGMKHKILLLQILCLFSGPQGTESLRGIILRTAVCAVESVREWGLQVAQFSCLFSRISCFPGGRLAFPTSCYPCAQESKSSRYIPPFLPPSALLSNASNHTAKSVTNSWTGCSNDCRYFGFTCLHLRVCGRPLKAKSLPLSWGNALPAWLCVSPCPVTQTALRLQHWQQLCCCFICPWQLFKGFKSLQPGWFSPPEKLQIHAGSFTSRLSLSISTGWPQEC